MTTFKFIREHKDKAQSPVAKNLLKKIEELLEKGNEARAQALMARYKRRYASFDNFDKLANYFKK